MGGHFQTEWAVTFFRNMHKARYLGIARNKARLGLMCLAYNIKRGVAIVRSCQMSAQGNTV